MEITDYLDNVVKPMLKHPDCFKVLKTIDSLGVLLTVDAHKEDMGLIIGRNGETAKSIRHVVRVVGMANKERVNIKINEPQSSA